MNNQPNSLNDQLALTFRPLYWYGTALKHFPATIKYFSTTGLQITSLKSLKMNQKVSLHLMTEFHTLKQLRAEVINIKKDQSECFYELKYCFGSLPETAKNNVQGILQIIENSLSKIPN